MKTVILAVLVLLVVSHGDALRCNCGGSRSCNGNVETCVGSSMVCISAGIRAGSTTNSFQGCYNKNDCKTLSQSDNAIATCCSTDLCN